MSEFSDFYNECPKCDNELSVEPCHGLGCEDGEYEDEDGINGNAWLQCDECLGKGVVSWCKECGWDADRKQFLSPKYEAEYLAKQATEK